MFIVINETFINSNFIGHFSNLKLFTFHTGHKSQVSNELNSGYD